jgi:hypothetical protein
MTWSQLKKTPCFTGIKKEMTLDNDWCKDCFKRGKHARELQEMKGMKKAWMRLWYWLM